MTGCSAYAAQSALYTIGSHCCQMTSCAIQLSTCNISEHRCVQFTTKTGLHQSMKTMASSTVQVHGRQHRSGAETHSNKGRHTSTCQACLLGLAGQCAQRGSLTTMECWWRHGTSPSDMLASAPGFLHALCQAHSAQQTWSSLMVQDKHLSVAC